MYRTTPSLFKEEKKMTDNGSKRMAIRPPPALNPEQLGLVQPWKDYVSCGLITELSVKWSPGGTCVSIDLAEHVKVPEGKPRNKLPPGLAKQYILDSGIAPTRAGTKPKNKEPKGQPLPVRSLCAEDFEEVGNLESRIKAVAMKLGSSVALGRIGSMKMNTSGATTFEDWWSSASADQKVRLVMDEKHLKSLSAAQTAILLTKLSEIGSPFHGPLPVKSENDETKAEGLSKEGQPPKSQKLKGKGPARK